MKFDDMTADDIRPSSIKKDFSDNPNTKPIESLSSIKARLRGTPMKDPILVHDIMKPGSIVLVEREDLPGFCQYMKVGCDGHLGALCD